MKKQPFIIALWYLLAIQMLVSQNQKPNILLITLDDMNWDSPGTYGGSIPDLTPHIDGLAKSGIQFEHAFVQAPNCSPSRVVIQTGLYPHQTGMRGFFYVKDNFNTLPEILRADRYFTGVINKPADTSLNSEFSDYWDLFKVIKGTEKRSAEIYAKLFDNFMREANKKGKPFYCVINVADPHKPFFNDPPSKKKGFDKFKPSKIYTKKDITIPGYLPKTPEIKKEVLNYVNSVKRGDDCVGEILKTLKESKAFENTVVILLSDHGAPFPYSKSSIYQNGIKTPLIISWPSKFATNKDEKSIVSSVDIAPTILELTGNKIPKQMIGKSFYKVLTQEQKKIGNYVFAQFDENAGGIPRPSRTVITKKYGYIFNPWANGKLVFKSASASHTTYKVMAKLSIENENVRKRFDFWRYRALEELYDYENDPNALNNLIDDPKYAEVLKELRSELHHHMMVTKDYMLSAYEKRDNPLFLNRWMKQEIEAAKERAKTLKWKRGKNHQGPTKKNKKLFSITEK